MRCCLGPLILRESKQLEGAILGATQYFQCKNGEESIYNNSSQQILSAYDMKQDATNVDLVHHVSRNSFADTRFMP